MTPAEYKSLIAKPKRHKYNAVPTVASDGIRCPSKKHAKVHESILLMKKAGLVKFFLREVQFDLPGGVKHRVDYLVFYSAGNYSFVEVKGRDLAMGKMKRKQVEDIYGIEVEVV